MQNFALQTKNKKKRKMMKKITKFLSMAVTFATFLFASCGNISGTIEDTTKDNTPTINEVRTVVFTTDSNGLFEFSNKNSNSRTILPDTVDTGNLNFYLIYKDTVNQSLEASVKKITFKADAGTTKKGTFVLQLPLSDYQFTLCAVPTTESGITESSAADDIKAAATFIGYANADFRYNDEVSFHMKANSSSTGKGDIDITLNHENSWQVPLNYKVTVGLYEIDTDVLIYPAAPDPAQELLDTSTTEASITNEKFSSTSKTIKQGEYNLVVKYNDTTHSITYEYSEKVIVLMNQTSKGTITIPKIIAEPPVAPTAFEAKFKDPKDSTKNNYQVEFTWTDNSNNEREFNLELFTLSTDDYIKLPAQDSDWTSVTGSSKVFNRLEFDASALKAAGSLNKGNESATFYLELGKRYIARIRAKNEAGVSDWAYLTMATTVENDWQKFDTDVQTINRFRISYTLNGGKFAAADATASEVTNPPALTHYASQHTRTPETTPSASQDYNVILSPDGITEQNWVTDKNGTTIDTAAAITLSKDNRYFYNWTEVAEGGKEYSTTVTLEDKPADYIKNINYYAANADVKALIALRTQPTADTYNNSTFDGIKVRKAVSSLYTGYKNLDLVANYDTSKQITVEIDDITLYELKPSYFALTFQKDSADLSESDSINSNNPAKYPTDYPNLKLGGTDTAPGKQLEISTGKVDTIIITANTSNVIPITKYNSDTKEFDTTDGDYDNMHLTIKPVSNNEFLVNGDRDENGKWTFPVNTWIPGSYHCEITANTSQIPEQTLSYVFTILISQ